MIRALVVVLGMLAADVHAAEFARADAPVAFEFPRDHGPHNDFRAEWWYVTGHLDAANGERFGFELTFFRVGLTPGAGEQKGSAWRSNQVYMAHFAITDIARKQFHFAERYSRGALGLAGSQGEPLLKVWLENWQLEALDDAQWKLHAADKNYALTLDLKPLMQPVLNGDRGLSRKSSNSNAASYYYSIPRIAVTGQLTRDNRPHEVKGEAWLDREWRSGDLDVGRDSWDWYAIQLEDNSTLMFYTLRNRDGSRDINSAGTWVGPDGQVRILRNDEVQIQKKGEWVSPRGGIYPSRWQVTIPSLALSLDIAPVLANQELDTNPRYWEGAVDAKGLRNGRKTSGRGYVELVGYAKAPP